MFEVVIKIVGDDVDKIQGKMDSFIDVLQEHCDLDVEITINDESKLTEEGSVGYRYDSGELINDSLQKLCQKVGVNDWREIPIPELGLSDNSCYCIHEYVKISTLKELIEVIEEERLYYEMPLYYGWCTDMEVRKKLVSLGFPFDLLDEI